MCIHSRKMQSAAQKQEAKFLGKATFLIGEYVLEIILMLMLVCSGIPAEGGGGLAPASTEAKGK